MVTAPKKRKTAGNKRGRDAGTGRFKKVGDAERDKESSIVPTIKPTKKSAPKSR